MQTPEDKNQATPTLTVHVNPMLRQGQLHLSAFHRHLEELNFFPDNGGVDRAMAPIVAEYQLLEQLCVEFDVVVTFRVPPFNGKSPFEFSCVRAYPIDKRPGMQMPNMGMGDQAYGGRYYSESRSNMMGNPMSGPNGHLGNNDLVQLLGLYALTQIQPMPPQIRGSNPPAGLELLELVKERLTRPQFPAMASSNRPYVMHPDMMPMGDMNFTNHPFGNRMSGMSSMMGAMPGLAAAFAEPGYEKDNNGNWVEKPRANFVPNYTRYTRADKHTTVGYDLTPPLMPEGEVYAESAIDNVTDRVIHYSTSRKLGGFVVYDCTRKGNMLQRMEYPAGLPWHLHPGLAGVWAIPKVPLQTFKFQVSDTTEDTLNTLVLQINALKLPRHVHQLIIDQVQGVLSQKPINSSEFTTLNFTSGIRALMAEGLNEALPKPFQFCWIIHTDLIADDKMPERFWTLTSETPRSRL